jgi:hypothetical protein
MRSTARNRFHPSRIVVSVAVIAVVMAFGQIASATGSTVRKFSASVSPGCVAPGSTLTYTATLTNSPSSSSGQVITSGFFHSTVKSGISHISSFTTPVASNGRQWKVLPDLIDADGFTLVAKSSSQALRPGETVTVTWSGTAALNSSGTTFAMLVLGSGTFSGTAPSVQFTTSCPAKTFSFGTIGTQTSGVPFGVQITALDANNNTATGFNGTAQLTSSPAGLDASPVTVTFVNGVSNPSVSITGAGSFTLTATSSSPSITGTSNTFSVGTPHFVVEAAGGGDIGTQVAGAPFNIQVRLLDASDQVVTGFTGDVQLTSSPDGLVDSPVTVHLTNGESGPVTITMGASGDAFTLTATSGSITGTSAPTFPVTADANLSCTSTNPDDRTYTEGNPDGAGTLSVFLKDPGSCTTTIPVTVDVSTQGTVVVTKPNVDGAVFQVTVDWIVDQNNDYPLETQFSTDGVNFQTINFCDAGPSIPDGETWCVFDSHTYFDDANVKQLHEVYLGNFDVTFKRHP